MKILGNPTILNYTITSSLFVSGFFISRMFIKANLASTILLKFLKTGKGKVTRLILIIMLSSALLSSFIPNMITVLTLLPIISLLYKDFNYLEKKQGELSTPFVISLIYSANIGGIISITGSPANALLLGSLPILQKEYNINFIGIDKINFFSWLSFGLPIALVLILIGWVLICLFVVPSSMKKKQFILNKKEIAPNNQQLKSIVIFISVISLFCWLAISIIQTIFPKIMIYLTLLSVIQTVILITVVFFVKINYNTTVKKPILQVKDIYTGLPKKGVLLSFVAVIFTLILMFLNVPRLILPFLKNFTFIKTFSLFFVFWAFAIATTFLTEVFSNSIVALTILPFATIASIKLHFHVLSLLFLISFSTTCAFMSPIATPVNAFAFGSLQKVSLKKMLFTGSLMNIISSLWLAFCAFYFLPLFIR